MMLGLIKKDFLILKANFKNFLIFLIVYAVLAIKGVFDMSFVFSFVCIMIFISTFNYDDFNNWNAYAITLPSGKKTIVQSKYVATILLLLLSSAIGIAFSITAAITKGNVDLKSIVSSLMGGMLSISLIVTIVYPLYFKYGTEKGRITLFFIFIFIAISGGILSKYVDFSALKKYAALIENRWFITIPVFITVIYVISYLISERIYLKKEF